MQAIARKFCMLSAPVAAFGTAAHVRVIPLQILACRRNTRRSTVRLLQFKKTLCAVAAVVVLSISASPQTFTLDQVLSSPFPSGLTAAKGGHRVAWVFNSQGVRNVWVADESDFVRTARQATHYAGDDGQTIASLRLTPNDKTVVYVRGSELNDQGDSADPDHKVDQPKQQVWAQDVDSSESPRVLGEM